MKKIILTLILILTIAIAVPLSIEKDIEIMESVLDKIIVEDSPIYFSFGNRFEGEYYDNYGIILSCESSGVLALTEIIEVNVDRVPYFISDKDDKKVVVKKKEKDVKTNVDEKQKSIDEKLNETRVSLEDFMLNYARGAMSMKDNEKIMINIKFKETMRGNKNLKTPVYMQMSANVTDLKKYYSGKLSETKMKKALKYEAPLEAPSNKDIDVMEDIFDTFLDKDNDFINLHNATSGTYLDGFGAVFNIPVSSGRGILPMSMNFEVLEKKLEDGAKQIEVHAKALEEKIAKMEVLHKNSKDKMDEKEKNKEKKVIKKDYKWKQKSDDEDSHVYFYTSDDDENTTVTVHGDSLTLDMDIDVDCDVDGERNIFVFGDHFKIDDTKIDSIMNKTKDEVIKTLSIYGSTLKSVKDNENVNVNLEFDSHEKDRDINLVCSKKNINDYTNGKIDYDKFIKNIKVK